MECYTIDYNGKTFKFQEVHHKNAKKKVLVGSNSLSEELMSDYNKHAQAIDERFYGYVQDSVFDLPYSEFDKYVNKYLQ